MTILAEIPRTWRTTPITRSIDHRYTYDDITYPGVSDIIACVGASFDQASAYGAKHTAKAAVRLIDELPKMLDTLGPEGVEKALKAKASWGPDPSGSILGTQVHEAIEAWFKQPGEWAMDPRVGKRLDHFTEWWNASGWTLRLSEAMVVHPASEHGQDGWGGTFDILARDRDGRTVLADIKTGSVYSKAVLQLAAYGMATLVQPKDSPTVYPMPIPDRYVILNVTDGGCREIEVAVGTAERMAFLACLEIWHWQESMKGKRL